MCLSEYEKIQTNVELLLCQMEQDRQTSTSIAKDIEVFSLIDRF